MTDLLINQYLRRERKVKEPNIHIRGITIHLMLELELPYFFFIFFFFSRHRFFFASIVYFTNQSHPLETRPISLNLLDSHHAAQPTYRRSYTVLTNGYNKKETIDSKGKKEKYT